MLFLIFNAALALVFAYTLWRGGAPERLVATFFVVAAVGTAATPTLPHNYSSLFWAVMWIDIALFAALTGVALFADRYWPLWLSAMQLFVVATHAAKAYQPAIIARAYWLVTSYIALPMVLLLLIGTIRHRERLAAGLPERAWTGRGRDRAT